MHQFNLICRESYSEAELESSSILFVRYWSTLHGRCNYSNVEDVQYCPISLRNHPRKRHKFPSFCGWERR